MIIHSQAILAPFIQRLNVTSKSFKDVGSIPQKFTCDGINVNPTLEISFIPNQAKSLAILMEDPDAPINTWTHWLVWNIPVMHSITENLKVGVQGLNDFSRAFYCGPCPMSGCHHYVFKVFALDTLLNLEPRSRKHDFLRSINGHVIAYGELTGLYTRKSNQIKDIDKQKSKTLTIVQ